MRADRLLRPDRHRTRARRAGQPIPPGPSVTAWHSAARSTARPRWATSSRSRAGSTPACPTSSRSPTSARCSTVPWEPGVAHVHRRRLQPGRLAVGREPADGAQAGDRQVRRAGHATRSVGPELEFYVLERATSNPTGWKRYGEATGNVYVAGLQGRPGERPAPVAAPAAATTGCEVVGGEPRVLQRPVRDQPRGTPRRSTPPTAPSGSSPRSRSWPARRASSPPSWPSRSTTRAAPGSTSTSRPVDDDGQRRLRRPDGARRAVRHRHVTPSPASSPTPRRWPRCPTRPSTPTSGSAPTPWRRG